MKKYSESIEFPYMYKIKQNIKQEKLDDTREVLKKQLNEIKINEYINKDEKIGITVGSRGMSNLIEILEELIFQIKKLNAEPVIIPAMGSHGGGTAEGQIEMLKSLGVSEEKLGVKILASEKSIQIGETEFGMPVYANENVVLGKVDKIIIFNRIKEHTEFQGDIESGIHKMCSIGLGNPKGALTVHQWAIDVGYEKAIIAAGEYIINELPVIFAVGTLENYYHEISKIVVMKKSQIKEKEKEYLKIAKSMLGKIPFDKIDVLIIDKIGKNISGSGADTNVIGRIKVYGQKELGKPDIKRIVVVGITEESHGTITGIGLADFTTKEVVENIDLPSTYLNCITAQSPEKGMIPIYFENEKESIAAALTCIGSIDSNKARVVHIKNTNEVASIEVSESLIEEVQKNEKLEIKSDKYRMEFDENLKIKRIED